MVNFGPLAADIGWRLWGKLERLLRLGIVSVTVRQSSTGRQPNCGVQQMAPPIFDTAAMTLGIGPHF